MSSRKVKGGKIGVKLIKNTSKVSSVCCDVIGDVCGIISGTSGVVIVSLIIKLTNNEHAEAGEPTNDIALASVVPGTVLSKQNNTDNPFENEKGQIKVIDIKKNGKNEIWIKYIYADELFSNAYVPTVYYDKLKDILQSHPIVKLPASV
jgi:hypothetical protein